MFVDELKDAVRQAPRSELARLSGLLWKAYAAGAIGEDDAQGLSEAIEARKAPTPLPPPRKRPGSRPRSPESMERRRKWAASGRLPPPIAARFTLAEVAVLAVVAVETLKCDDCRLTIGHIAALAGVCASTVRNAMREAAQLGLLTIEERRITAFRNAPNIIRVISAEWHAWLRLYGRRPDARGGCKSVQRTPIDSFKHTLSPALAQKRGLFDGKWRRRGANYPGRPIPPETW